VVYFLHSEMNALDYLMEPVHSCAVYDVNAMAFEEATKITGGRDAVVEFLICGILPLSNNWSLEIERAAAPLSKVIVPLPKAPMMIGGRETGAAFEMRIATMANQFVGNYRSVEH
jgi:hypothetical protein